jgi:hypothetical protein
MVRTVEYDPNPDNGAFDRGHTSPRTWSKLSKYVFRCHLLGFTRYGVVKYEAWDVSPRSKAVSSGFGPVTTTQMEFAPPPAILHSLPTYFFPMYFSPKTMQYKGLDCLGVGRRRTRSMVALTGGKGRPLSLSILHAMVTRWFNI